MADQKTYQFGVSEFTTWPWTFEEDVENYARLGVQSIEVCEFKLDPARIGDQLALAGQHGLPITSIQPVIHTVFPNHGHPDPSDPQERMAQFRKTIDRVGQYARGVPLVTNTGRAPNGNCAEVFAVCVREYQALADYAADKGVKIALEPLNAAMVNEDTIIWLLPQAMQMVDAVNRPNFGVCVDCWNIWQDAALADHIKACGDRIFVVQLSDWRLPRSFYDRYIIGQGEIPMADFLRAIHATGYQGAYALEIFSENIPDSLWKQDLSRVIQESRAGLDSAWQAAMS